LPWQTRAKQAKAEGKEINKRVWGIGIYISFVLVFRVYRSSGLSKIKFGGGILESEIETEELRLEKKNTTSLTR